MTGLRAASLGVPFEPLPGLTGTDLPSVADFRTVKDPWTGEEIYVVPVQVDARGRVNSTVIGPFDRPKVRLPGGGGAAVLFQVVRRLIVYRTRHDPRSFPATVDFVTASGHLERVVTPLAVFRATPEGLRLEGLQPGATLDDVRRRTGFPVIPTEDCAVLAPPTLDELRALDALDPGRIRDLDFQ